MLFAAQMLATSAASFPLLLDRDVELIRALANSIAVMGRNPGPMAAWGAVVAGGILLGSLPLFLGQVVVIPVLAHASWRLYRRAPA